MFTASFWIPEVAVWVSVTSWRTAGAAASVFIGSALLEGEVSNGHHSRDRTHGKDLKDILEVQLPGSDCLFIFPRAETPTDRVPFDPLRELPPNICYGPAVESITMSSRDACRWFNSHRQLVYRTIHRLTELV